MGEIAIPNDFNSIGCGVMLEHLHARLHRHSGEVIPFEFSFLGKLSLWVLIAWQTSHVSSRFIEHFAIQCT